MRLLLLFELLLLVAWIVIFILLSAAFPSPDIWFARLSLVLSLLGHPGTALVLIKLDHELDAGKAKRVGFGRFFWLFGNLFTDVWSVVDAWVDLAERDLAPTALALVRGFTTTALVASSLGVIVYVVALVQQHSRDDTGTTTTTITYTQREVVGVGEPLLPQPRVQPLRARRGV